MLARSVNAHLGGGYGNAYRRMSKAGVASAKPRLRHRSRPLSAEAARRFHRHHSDQAAA